MVPFRKSPPGPTISDAIQPIQSTVLEVAGRAQFWGRIRVVSVEELDCRLELIAVHVSAREWLRI